MLHSELLGNKLVLCPDVVVEQYFWPWSNLWSVTRRRRLTCTAKDRLSELVQNWEDGHLTVAEQCSYDDEVFIRVQRLVTTNKPFVISD